MGVQHAQPRREARCLEIHRGDLDTMRLRQPVCQLTRVDLHAAYIRVVVLAD